MRSEGALHRFGACGVARKQGQSARIGPVAESGARRCKAVVRSEQRRGGGPGLAVPVAVRGANLGADRDQLRQVGDGGELAERGHPLEAVRVEVVAEEQPRVGVRRLEEPWAAVVEQVALVDGLDPERVPDLGERAYRDDAVKWFVDLCRDVCRVYAAHFRAGLRRPDAVALTAGERYPATVVAKSGEGVFVASKGKVSLIVPLLGESTVGLTWVRSF